MLRHLILALLAAVVPAVGITPLTASDGWDDVGRVLQSPAIRMGSYVRYALPRGDIALTMGDVRVAVPLALGGWVGFAGEPGMATMMGDLVVTADELGPVQQSLVQQGIEVTAVHNHLAGERPSVMYLHVHAMGAAAEIATRLDTVLRKTAIVRPSALAAPLPPAIDTAFANHALGAVGRVNGAVAQYGFMLVRQPVMQHGIAVVPALALATPVSLQALSETRWVASGDFAVSAAAVTPTVKALARGGVLVTAAHSHLVGESPTVTYIHFWTDGTPAAVTTALRAALDAAR